MRKTLILLLTLVPGVAIADDGEWFVGLKASLGEDTIDSISAGGTIGTGMMIGNEIDGQIADDEVDDYTAGVGFSAGRRFGNWTVEGEYIYRYRTDWDIAASTPSITSCRPVGMKSQPRLLAGSCDQAARLEVTSITRSLPVPPVFATIAEAKSLP